MIRGTSSDVLPISRAVTGTRLGALCSRDHRVQLEWWARTASGEGRSPGASWMSREQRQRIDALVDADDPSTRLLAHAVASSMVNRVHSGMDPSNAVIDHAPDGRPMTRCGLEVSLSHSRTVVAVGVGKRGVRIGVDVEDIERADEAAHVAGMIAHPREEALLGTCPKARLKLWVAKEAAVKIGFTSLDEAHLLDLSALLEPGKAGCDRRIDWWRVIVGRMHVAVWNDQYCVGALARVDR